MEIQPASTKMQRVISIGRDVRGDAFAVLNKPEIAERDIIGVPEHELSNAIQNGTRSASERDGTLSYLHENVVYVTTHDGRGITARRLEPLQCTCHVGSIAGAENGFDKLDIHDENRAHVRTVMQGLVLEMRKFEIGACANFETSDATTYPPFCLGGKHCKEGIHRTPTDHLAILLEKRDWSSYEMRGVLSYPGLLGYLILGAAGSLLRPVRCGKCYGVAKLKRSENILDEGEALVWLRQLLNKMENVDQTWTAELKKEGGNVPDRISIPEIAAGLTPLALAAIGGHYQIALELLKRGATVDMALRRINGIGPLAGGHLFCYLMAQSHSPSNRQLQDAGVFCGYEDILALFCYAYAQQENGGGDVFNVPIGDQEKTMQLFKDIGVWDAFKQQTKLLGYTPVGYVWDGFHYRYVLKGDDEGCVSGATVVFNLGMRLPNSPATIDDIIYKDPLNDPFVKEMVKHIQKATKKLSPKGNSCCEFSHEVLNILMKEHMDRVKYVAGMMRNVHCN